ncbi:ANTAR domain-containing protein [Streptomyces sp. NPDC059215]|uniref:ANTAR domain-containing protein n=1 Tax=Streptomyces sp. NPDC059215 TaxID=3346772 RepID=UPI003695D51F
MTVQPEGPGPTTAGKRGGQRVCALSKEDPRRVAELREENAQLEEAMRAHAVVDQAVGVILAVARLTPEQGRDVLGGVSEVTGIKLGHVAELIVGWARSGQLCSDIRTELDQQLLRHAPPASAGD